MKCAPHQRQLPSREFTRAIKTTFLRLNLRQRDRVRARVDDVRAQRVAARARLYGHVARGDIGDVDDAVSRRGCRRRARRAARVVTHLAGRGARHRRPREWRAGAVRHDETDESVARHRW